MKGDIPTFSLVRTHTATTYHLSADKHGWGALCTVNDATGELQIISGWGNWAYLWSARPSHLGAPTLTHFLADRDAGHYLADKLTSGEDKKRQRHDFSAEKTVADLREYLVARFKETRDLRNHRGYLSGREFRRIYQELGELAHQDEREFVAALYEIDGHERVSDAPWEHLRYEPTIGYLILLNGIIPALIAACQRTIADRERMLDEAYEATAALVYAGAHS